VLLQDRQIGEYAGFLARGESASSEECESSKDKHVSLDVEAFRENGYAVIRGAVPAALCEALVLAIGEVSGLDALTSLLQKSDLFRCKQLLASFVGSFASATKSDGAILAKMGISLTSRKQPKHVGQTAACLLC
jgi:hypothetical protein